MSNFLSEEQVPFSWCRLAGEARCFVYNGSSMRPTFEPGQLLLIRPLEELPAGGDVVIFTEPGSKRNVVHRVFAIDPPGRIWTRGDNNRRPDPGPVPLGWVVGRVERAERNGRLVKVTGGWLGLWLASLRWSLIWAGHRLRTWFGQPYRFLRSRRWAAGLWRPTIRRLNLWNQDGPLVKYLHKERTVATWLPSSHQFSCRKPYDLVIPAPDGASLLSGYPDGKEDELA